MDKQTILYLDEPTANKFVLFQQYYSPFTIMLEHRVFDQKACAITLHFDKQGLLRTIARNDMLYSYGIDFENTN